MLSCRMLAMLSSLELFCSIVPAAAQEASAGRQVDPFPPPAWNDPTFGINGVGVSRKHDLCDRWRKVYVDKTVEVRNALKNQTLSTIWPLVEGYQLEGLHYTDATGSLTEKGLMMEIFNELSRRAGFNWRSTYGFFELPATSPATRNKTWTDVLYWTAQHYDVSVGWYPDLTVHKSKGYLFPEHWFDSSLILVTRGRFVELPILERAFSFLKPFTLELWTLVMVSWVFAGAVYWFLEQGGEHDHEFSYSTNWQNMCLSIMYTALEWGGGKWHHPHTFAGRIFTFVWLFVRLLFVSMYTAHLASSFVSNTLTEYPVTSLAQAIEKRYPICIEEASEPLKVISELYRNAKLLPVHERDVFEHMEQGRCVAAILPLDEWRLQQGISSLNMACRFQYVGRPIRSMRSGLALAENNATCTSLASTVIDIHLQEMVMEGFVEDAWQRYLDLMHDQTCLDEESSTVSESMGVVQTGGLFLGLVIGAILSIAISCSPGPSCSLGGHAKNRHLSYGSNSPNASDASTSASEESEEEDQSSSHSNKVRSRKRSGTRTQGKSFSTAPQGSAGLHTGSPQGNHFSHLPPDIALELQRVSESLQILSRSTAVSPATAPAGGGVSLWGNAQVTGSRGSLPHFERTTSSAGTPASAPESCAPWGSVTGSRKSKGVRVRRKSNASGSTGSSDTLCAHGKDKSGHGQSPLSEAPRQDNTKMPHSPSTRNGTQANALWKQPIEPRAEQAQLARARPRSPSPPDKKGSEWIAHQLEEDFLVRERQLEAASQQLQSVHGNSQESEAAVYRVKAMLNTISKELVQARGGDSAPNTPSHPSALLATQASAMTGRVARSDPPGGPQSTSQGRGEARASRWDNYC